MSPTRTTCRSCSPTSKRALRRRSGHRQDRTGRLLLVLPLAASTAKRRSVVISQDDYPLCRRGELWLQAESRHDRDPAQRHRPPDRRARPGRPTSRRTPHFADWQSVARRVRPATRSAAVTGVSDRGRSSTAAILYATGGAGTERRAPDGGYPAVADLSDRRPPGRRRSAIRTCLTATRPTIAAACNNLAILTGNIGRAGGGVASLRGPANYQGVTDMGAILRSSRAAETSRTRTVGRVRSRLAAALGGDARRPGTASFRSANCRPAAASASTDLAAAIERGEVKAMYHRRHDRRPRTSSSTRARTPRCRSSKFLVVARRLSTRRSPSWPTSSCRRRCRWKRTAPSPASTAPSSGFAPRCRRSARRNRHLESSRAARAADGLRP